ncbi:hypothetical protein [Flavobacterium collinsii]|uniref:Uncharacterized protein n=1 Tax=Flavobacterium collinsii TaxID=1114861 RepID=A0A9W4TI11_9FLAO|nr:hypothetical protein [Flavobacterium collinsii]CAI2767337.1 conserved protein of unknown function [Flavobacterium collinsii]
MMREQLYHLYYSGTDVYDLAPEWTSENKEHFCHDCTRLKLPHSAMDIITNGRIRKNLDMTIIGHNLIPGAMSYRLLELLGTCARKHLNIGTVYNNVAGNSTKQPFVTFISKHKYIVLRGENPDVFDGIPIPENEREIVCPQCHFQARRERFPFFLLESEYPDYPICCTNVGLLIYESVYSKIKNNKLIGVRVEKVKIK